MINFIWQSWWRNKERFILLLVGAIIISVGLTYLVGLSETSKGTVVDELQKRWSASYDIVVRPEGSRSITEDENLLEPNYLSNIEGGISLEQYEKIKAIPNVEVAAPIAMVGQLRYMIKLATDLDLENGFYRVVENEVHDSGINELSSTRNGYFPYADWDLYSHVELLKNYMGIPNRDYVYAVRDILLAGIDPLQEANLVGLDQSILDIGDGRYFTEKDLSRETLYDYEETGRFDEIHIPIILSNYTFTDKTVNVTVEQLPLPFSYEEGPETLATIEQEGGERYLDSLEGKEVYSFSLSDNESFTRLMQSISGIDLETGYLFGENHLSLNSPEVDIRGEVNVSHGVTPLKYSEISSPYPERWPFAYQLDTFTETFHHPEEDETFEIIRYRHESSRTDINKKIIPEWIGYYDPRNLDMSQDPTTELPMETYRPASAELVLDANDQPVNPPAPLRPVESANTFLSSPPTMLTTIEAASMILGDDPISAIRIKVAGVSGMSEGSQQILEQVANDIERETGLFTDITLGSSPQPTLTHVPETTYQEELGWFQQPWVRIGASITLFREAKFGYSGLVVSIMAVAIVYVWASSFVNLLARRSEFALLLAVGWRPRQLSRILVYESTLLGGFVAFLSWLMMAILYITGQATFDFIQLILIGIIGFTIYLLGAVVPVLSVRKITSYEAMKTGEISKESSRVLTTRGLSSMAFNHFVGKWRRSILSILAIAFPTALLALFLYVTIRLQGVMFTTWLGQYVALEVGPVHYVVTIIALIIAILTTAEIMWQNIAERHQEIGLLKAIGWKNRSVRALILIEGVFIGVFSSILGITLGLSAIWFMYKQLPLEDFPFILLVGLIPFVVGIIGTLPPSERAVRISPLVGMTGNRTNQSE